MLPLRGGIRRCSLHRSACLLAWSMLAVGCAQSDPTEMERLYHEWSTSTESDDSWILAPNAVAMPDEQADFAESPSTIAPTHEYWGSSDDTDLVRLPSVDQADSAELEVPVDESVVSALTPESPRDNETSPSNPDTAEIAESEPPSVQPEFDAPMPDPVDTKPNESVVSEPADSTGRAIELPQFEELSAEERHLLELITRESLSATTGALTDKQLDQQCRVKISAAYTLSQRGAAYAARAELIGVLRLISQAKDSREATRSRTASLAAGLRALEEAHDFMPHGAQLEAEMNLTVICAAHRTPLARELNLAAALPAKMMERYHRYAQIKLAVAVAGEPAGSMALYSLGKLNSLLAATEGEKHPLASRETVAFQQAALLAHNENFMAAHELGVLLAESGHFPEAQHLLVQVAAEQPNSVVFRNLARVQDALGNATDAQLCRNESTRLAQQGRGRQGNITWVSPQEFSHSQLNNFTPQVASRPTTPSQPTPAVAWR